MSHVLDVTVIGQRIEGLERLSTTIRRHHRLCSQMILQFLRTTAVPADTAEAHIISGDSVCLSVRLSQPGGVPNTGEIETPGLHHMVAWSI